jgi:hypothetical protein
MKCHNFKKESVKKGWLKSYLALTAGFVAISPLTDAQIIYTDVNPDSVLTGNESFQLDINKDGTFDYTIQHKSFNSQGKEININSFTGLGGNQVFSAGLGSICSSWHYVPKPLNSWDEMITEHMYKVWRNGGFLFRDPPTGCGRTGLWKGAIDKYVGFRFKINGDFYYGWARMDVDSSSKSVTLKDYAYNSEVGKPIRAGSTKVSLPDENPLKNIRVYSTGSNIRIEAPTDQKLTGKIMLTDINGRELSSVDVENENNISLNTRELTSGVYIVNIITEKGTLNKRVLIR